MSASVDKIEVYHLRYGPDGIDGGLMPASYWTWQGVQAAPHGGVTIARAISHSGETIAEGRAYCHPTDPFVKKLGNIKARGRLRGKLLRAGVYDDDPA